MSSMMPSLRLAVSSSSFRPICSYGTSRLTSRLRFLWDMNSRSMYSRNSSIPSSFPSVYAHEMMAGESVTIASTEPYGRSIRLICSSWTARCCSIDEPRAERAADAVSSSSDAASHVKSFAYSGAYSQISPLLDRAAVSSWARVVFPHPGPPNRLTTTVYLLQCDLSLSISWNHSSGYSRFMCQMRHVRFVRAETV